MFGEVCVSNALEQLTGFDERGDKLRMPFDAGRHRLYGVDPPVDVADPLFGFGQLLPIAVDEHRS
jgi:hypothetical protein